MTADVGEVPFAFRSDLDLGEDLVERGVGVVLPNVEFRREL